METRQGDPILIHDPVAQELLHSTELARLAYVWDDGTPRVVPLWFHWDGQAVVFGTFLSAPKVHAIPDGASVAITIDGTTWPYHVLSIRGLADVSVVDGVADEYARAACRYFGEEQGQAWTATVAGWFSQTVRIAVQPTWVGILDFERRFPHAVAEAISRSTQA